MRYIKIILFTICIIAGMALDSEGVYGWIALAVALASAVSLGLIYITKEFRKEGKQ